MWQGRAKNRRLDRSVVETIETPWREDPSYEVVLLQRSCTPHVMQNGRDYKEGLSLTYFVDLKFEIQECKTWPYHQSPSIARLEEKLIQKSFDVGTTSLVKLFDSFLNQATQVAVDVNFSKPLEEICILIRKNFEENLRAPASGGIFPLSCAP